MSDVKHRFVQTNGIRMHVAEMGEGYPVVLCHGWPELWYSWRHQMKALADAGFRAIAPDMRGYGETDGPQEIESYSMRNLVADMVGLLDALEIEKAVIIGHDWGGAVAWNSAMMEPDRWERVVSLNTPLLERSARRPTDEYREVAGDNVHYVLYFQEPGVAEAEFERDIERSIRSTYQVPEAFDLEERSKAPPGVFKDGELQDNFPPPGEHGTFLTPQDFQVFLQAFKKTGFRGSLNYYRNVDRNWEESASLEHRVDQPALMITAELDFVLLPSLAEGMEKRVPNLRKTVLIKGSGHWTQQEKPAEVNAAILDFLSDMKK